MEILEHLFEGHSCDNCFLHKIPFWCDKNPKENVCIEYKHIPNVYTTNLAVNEKIYTLDDLEKAYLKETEKK